MFYIKGVLIHLILLGILWSCSCSCSVAQSCPTLCDPMDCSMPGFTILHHHPEFAQIYAIESVMPSNHLIFYRPLLLLPSIIPSIRVFSNELVLHIRWPKDWSFSFSISPSNKHSGLISFKTGNSTCYKWGPQGRETLGNLSRITQRVTCETRIFPYSRAHSNSPNGMQDFHNAIWGTQAVIL